ncbi:NAD-dependent epimerase/dehydratase family protein [Amylibacter sp.]|nr:NAD-dependent epimerase/dehydratase family protein [Amylibacter sp.]
MKIIILGGDGFCGWPASLYFSEKGHDVMIIDNLSRRNIDIELGTSSLTPIETIQNRLTAWTDLGKNKISFENIDLANDYQELKFCLESFKPDVIIHFAEQRAAPYSMKSAKTKRYTIDNNTKVTHNVLCALVESHLDTHVVHLGTMGVYGYGTAGMAIPEGYLTVTMDSDKDNADPVKREILYPTDPGSIYHLTKTMDQLLFHYYAKNDNMRITDLHQGIVWGTQTPETLLDDKLINRFDYDGDYGTVLNRFILQAALGYPLTVHGTGGQTRAFININDTLKCLEIAILNPPSQGDKVKVFNQITETHRVSDLANLISKISGTSINYVKNPRNEAESNDLHVSNDLFLSSGLNPTKLNEGLINEVKEIANKYSHLANKKLIPCVSNWSK